MSRPERYTAFLEPQRREARRLYEVERWTFLQIAARFGVSKGSIAGVAHRQQWLRAGETERRRIIRDPARRQRAAVDSTSAGPRDVPDTHPPQELADVPVTIRADLGPVVDAPHPTVVEVEESGPPEAERGCPPDTAVAAEEVVAGASSAAPIAPEDVPTMAEIPATASPSLASGSATGARPRAARLAEARDRTTAERSLDTILGHARARAAPPMLVAPMVSTPPVRHRTCQWPHGEPGTSAFRFCDAAAVPGRSYCLEHCAVAYVRFSAQRGAPA